MKKRPFHERYLPQAINSLKQQVVLFWEFGYEWVGNMSTFVRRTALAVPWHIVDINNLWDIDLTTVDFTHLYPPYPDMVIEYEIPPDFECVDKRISVRAEKHIVVVTNGTKIGGEDGQDRGEEGFSVSQVINLPGSGEWVVSPLTLLVSREALDSASEWAHRGGYGLYDDVIPGCEIIGTFQSIDSIDWQHPALVQLEEVDVEGPTVMEHISRQLLNDLKVVLGLMALLTCTNIEVSQEKGMRFTNAKREKKGKPPLPAYHTVVIHHNPATRQAHRAALKEGSGASKRSHWRRGHRRTLAPEHHVWVRPCRVGGDPNISEYEIL